MGIEERRRTVVRLVGSRECHLCDEAAGLLEDLGRTLGFSVERVNTDDNPDLERAYRWAIPVVLYGTRELARAPIRREALHDALQEALSGLG